MLISQYLGGRDRRVTSSRPIWATYLVPGPSKSGLYREYIICVVHPTSVTKEKKSIF